ncbi:hypothetical protein NK6_1171 [Bradyrhizobium diazoefficiens]|uniref:Uncharacterized protein n=1 Tax=Bradyrhizobium diazoefficiens TaxID=1355477 RepID=A0A0E4FQT9_9BRAD|nr:hypothetical protein NK6_1171 [Bradyrhizobium diazoefficiens]
MYLASGERTSLMILRAPVFISTVAARPGAPREELVLRLHVRAVE